MAENKPKMIVKLQ